MVKPIFKDASWDFKSLKKVAFEIEKIGRDEMGMDFYPWQIEICSPDQMLDCYATNGLPILYNHWSFGKSYLKNYKPYKRGLRGLAYEMVINTDPSIIYCMEDNTAAMQALVIAHAGVGHGYVFKNNYTFKAGISASSVTDYLVFCKNYIQKCEDTYGVSEVEKILDAAHAVMWQSMMVPHNKSFNLENEKRRFYERQKYIDESYHEVWSSVPGKGDPKNELIERRSPKLPEDNLLYFLEKNSPVLLPWQQEILRIVRKLAQYFWPSTQCSVVHESAAVYSHLFCMRKLYEKGIINEGHMLEAIESTGAVVYQSSYTNWRGWNIYTLGNAIAQDIERICTNPTQEDTTWFPDFAGNQDPLKTLKHAWANYRDESFIRQFLSPKVIRDMKMFQILDDKDKDYYEITDIHDDAGYLAVRKSLADEYLPEKHFPDIKIVGADTLNDRVLRLMHYTDPGMPLHEEDKIKTLNYIHYLWGHPVELSETDRSGSYYIGSTSVVGK